MRSAGRATQPSLARRRYATSCPSSKRRATSGSTATRLPPPRRPAARTRWCSAWATARPTSTSCSRSLPSTRRPQTAGACQARPLARRRTAQAVADDAGARRGRGAHAARAAPGQPHAAPGAVGNPHAPVALTAPKGRKAPAIAAWAVLAQEQDGPVGVKPLEWMLLTTVQVSSAEQAVQRLAWCTHRWGIEVMHKTLKVRVHGVAAPPLPATGIARTPHRAKYVL